MPRLYFNQQRVLMQAYSGQFTGEHIIAAWRRHCRLAKTLPPGEDLAV
jgi:hypothetical protein